MHSPRKSSRSDTPKNKRKKVHGQEKFHSVKKKRMNYSLQDWGKRNWNLIMKHLKRSFRRRYLRAFPSLSLVHNNYDAGASVASRASICELSSVGVTSDLFRPRICSGRNKFACGYVPESADLFRRNKFASG